MKYLGVLLFTAGVGVFLFILYSFFSREQNIISPVPDTEGVKVIYISPEAEKNDQ